jgi:[ribosomal protein S18]-alanine N-acetyltransferase
MTPGIAIRDMTRADIDAALAIEEVSSLQPWTRGIFTDELADTVTRSYRVMTVDSTVIGFCGLLLQADEGHITNIAVEPSQRGRGFGAALLLDSIRIALGKKIRALTLEVRVSNVDARVLYQRFGFAPVGVRPKYYRVNNEDALIMWAHDVDAATYQVRLAEIASTLAHRMRPQTNDPVS